MSMRKRRGKSAARNVGADPHAAGDSGSSVLHAPQSRLLAEHGFDSFIEELCAPYYAEKRGAVPVLLPGCISGMLMIGYFEGLGSERAIAWRVADSLALRRFLGYALTQSTPDHSSLSRIRQRLPVEVHQAVFHWVLKVLADHDLLQGQDAGGGRYHAGGQRRDAQHRAPGHGSVLPSSIWKSWPKPKGFRNPDEAGVGPARQEAYEEGVQQGLEASPGPQTPALPK